MATTPFLTVLSTNLYYLTLVQTTSGFFLSGTVLLLFNLLLEQSPEASRTYCITTYNVLLAVVAFLAPQIGIWLLDMLGVETAMTLTPVYASSVPLYFLSYMFDMHGILRRWYNNEIKFDMRHAIITICITD